MKFNNPFSKDKKPTSAPKTNKQPNKFSFHIENPITKAIEEKKAEKQRREEERRRKEEEERRRREEEARRKREEEERKRRQSLIGLAILGVISFGGLGIGAFLEKAEENKQITNTPDPILANATPTPESTPTPTPRPTSTPTSTPSSTPELKEEIVTVAKETEVADVENEIEESSPTEEPKPTAAVNPYHKLDNMSISIRTDYGHYSDIIIQGNGETFEVTIDTKNKDATIDDVILYYDEGTTVISKDIITEGVSAPIIKYHVQCNTVGIHELALVSSFNDFKDSDNAYGYVLTVNKLNQHDGQVVYISYSGEKYHRTSTHAGDSYTATTLYDVEGLGIEPCGTCY